MPRFKKLSGSSRQKKLELTALLQSKSIALVSQDGLLVSMYNQQAEQKAMNIPEKDRQQLQDKIVKAEKRSKALWQEVQVLQQQLQQLENPQKAPGKINVNSEKASPPKSTPKSTTVRGDKAHLDPIHKAYLEDFGHIHGKPETTTLPNGKSAILLKFPDEKTAMDFFDKQAKAGHNFELLDKAGKVTHRTEGGKVKAVKDQAQVSMHPGTNTDGAKPVTDSKRVPASFDASNKSSKADQNQTPTQRSKGPSNG